MDPVRASDLHTEERNEGLSLVKVLVVMMALLIAGAVWLSVVLKDDDRAASAPSPSPVATRPTAQATPSKEFLIRRLRELQQIGVRLYETKDLSLRHLMYFQNSPLRAQVADEIHYLQKMKVTVKARYRPLAIQVVRATSSKAVLLEKARITLRFFDALKRDVTKGAATQLQRTKWVLKRQGEKWLIFDGVVIESQPSRN